VSNGSGKPYNRHLSHTGFKVAGQAVLVVAGVAYGLHRGCTSGYQQERRGGPARSGNDGRREPLSNISRDSESRTCSEKAALEALTARLASLEATVTQNSEAAVTKAELKATLDQAAAAMEERLDRRFELQSLSVASLREMVMQTDKLLERVLVHLENAAEETALIGLTS